MLAERRLLELLQQSLWIRLLQFLVGLQVVLQDLELKGKWFAWIVLRFLLSGLVLGYAKLLSTFLDDGHMPQTRSHVHALEDVISHFFEALLGYHNPVQPHNIQHVEVPGIVPFGPLDISLCLLEVVRSVG